MAIKTPDILPGEPGYVPKKERTRLKKEKEKKEKKKIQKRDLNFGKIKVGSSKFRIGRAKTTAKKELKFPIWRFKRKIGEITKKGDDISLKFNRLGSIGNFKHLIQDHDFQLDWQTREQELLITQKTCYLCKKALSKSAIPNLYHYNMWKKRAKILEDAEIIPEDVIDGKLTIEDGWNKFNDILEEGNRYYMSLKETALICATCAKKKGLRD